MLSSLRLAARQAPLLCRRQQMAFAFSSSRYISTSRILLAALAKHPPAQNSALVQGPSKEYIEAEEMDVEIIPPSEVQFNITEQAAQQLQAVAARQNNQGVALRVSVDSGGCHGYQYKVEIAQGRNLDDYVFEHPNIKPSNVFVDAISLSLINGSTVDYATELIGSSFKVVDNPQSKGSGCGCGTSWELK